ncbi:beta strand repeat-containing protein, partial [Segetibacter aerophilus]|uniref:beta strand repeat-containing protein n=1 Tax=Segetibacter aerophilus TaxID=670293 RepID=UPI001478206E
PANWRVSPAGNTTPTWAAGSGSVSQVAGSGSPTTGGSYNWGTAPTERAAGFMTNTDAPAYASPNALMANYQNTTGTALTSLNISFQAERYRTNTSPFTLNFSYSTDGTNWTAFTAGDISSTTFPTGSSAYNFTTPLTTYKSFSITVPSLPNTAQFYLRWVFNTGSSNTSQGVGLDEVSVSANPTATAMSANLGDHLSDANGNNIANPGETITYRDTIKNSGSASANTVTLTNAAPAGTTYTPNSLQTSALARDDSYAAGTTSGNVLTNDYGLKNGATNLKVLSFGTTGSNGLTTAAGLAGTTDAGGTLTVNADGTFNYTAPAGFTGFDKFSYVATTEVPGLPNNDAVVTIAVGTPATAVAETFPGGIGNVTITDNVLTNDLGTNITVTEVNGSAANVGVASTTAHGSVTVNSNGSFNYYPAAGYTGADAFTYRIDNGYNIGSTVTVNITLSNRIWFVNSAAASNGTGTQQSPFKQTGDVAGTFAADNIFYFESATPYTGSLTLLANQRIIGQDASQSLATIAGLTVPAYSTLPAMNTGANTITLTATNANIITLNSGNTIRGLTISNAGTGKKITGTSFGTLTLGNTATPDVILDGTGQALDLTTGTLAGALTSLTTTSSAAQGVN